MKYLYILIIAMLSLAACGSAEGTEDTYVVDPVFTPYVDYFKRLYGGEVKNLIVGFAIIKKNDKDTTIGICQKKPGLPNRILIDKGYWEGASLHSKEALIFHELGHCVLNRDHDDTMLNGAAASLMHTHLLTDDVYAPNKQYYHNELFGR